MVEWSHGRGPREGRPETPRPDGALPPVDTCCGTAYNTIVMAMKIVLDTNVLVAALRSRRGASFKLLGMLDCDRLEVSISVPLFLEYEDAASRLIQEGGLTAADVEGVLDYIAAIARHQRIFYLWRPVLRDPDDEMVLEVAVAGQCEAIVTYNKADFAGAEQFGLRTMTPRELLVELGAIP